MAELKKVLVVEDNERHRADAVRVLREAGIEVFVAKTAQEAEQMLDGYNLLDEANLPPEDGVDGVITDVYMPLQPFRPFDHADHPCGLVVAAKAAEKGLPVVLCTAGHHHGPSYEWINRLSGYLRLRMVDRCDEVPMGSEEAPSKDWSDALEALRRAMRSRT